MCGRKENRDNAARQHTGVAGRAAEPESRAALQDGRHKLQGSGAYTEAVPDALQVPDMQATAAVPAEPGASKAGALQQVRQPGLFHQRWQVRKAEEKDRIHALDVGGGRQGECIVIAWTRLGICSPRR